MQDHYQRTGQNGAGFVEVTIQELDLVKFRVLRPHFIRIGGHTSKKRSSRHLFYLNVLINIMVLRYI